MLITTKPHIYHCNRVAFGVPLEDIFYTGKLHPALENLLLESYKTVAKCPTSVADILSSSYYQGTLDERLKLKDRLIICEEFEGLNISAGAPLWVVRHFIGLLPVPLLPSYTDGRKFTWLEIAVDCKTSLVDYATRGRYNPKLVKKIASELLRLPWAHLLMVTTLFDLFRKLVVLPSGGPKTNKSAIFAVVKYFSSSLFLRPFRPGWTTKKDKQYHPLLLYLILKWPELRKICIKPKDAINAQTVEELYPEYYRKLTPGYPLYISKSSKNHATQTATHLRTIAEENNSLIRIVPPSYDDFAFLRDTACQTEKVDDKIKANQLKRQVIFIKKDCCCTYSTNYETKRDNYYDEGNQSDSLPSNSNFDSSQFKAYGWKFHENQRLKNSNSNGHGWKINENGSSCSSPTDFIESENYMYDGYSKFNLISDADDIDSIACEDVYSPSNDLKEKMLKIGWTYTPPTKSKPTPIHTAGTSSASYNIPHEDYKLLCETRKSLNAELKEKLNKLKIKEKYDRECGISECDDRLSESTSKPRLSKNCGESQKSLINVGKIASKFEFLNLFNAKKEKTKRSCSNEQVEKSGVKYKKMGSTNSLL